MNGSFSTLPELIDAAKESLPEPVWNWIAGGTSGEHSLVANQRAISDWYFHPENLTGAPPVDLTTEIFGLTTSLPVFVAPFGGDGSIHPERYLGVARALAATGNTSIVSETSTDSMEDVASALDGMQGMLQLSLLGSDERIIEIAERAAAAGYRGLCLIDSPIAAWRERSRRWANELELPRYSGVGNQSTGMISPGELQRDPAQPPWTWERLASVSTQLPIPWIFKGVTSASDAHSAIAAGASGVYVSNFGGRKLDGMVPTIDVLPEVVEEVAGRVPVYIDSGFRRGTDIAKALALGARAVGLGRLTAWSLAAGGEKGVRNMLELLEGELTSVIRILGVSRPSELRPDHVARLSR